MKELVLMDYAGNEVCTGVNVDEVNNIEISVISGDEIADVTFADGTFEAYDSGEDRYLDFDDGYYTLIDREKGIDRYEEFVNRKDSYELLDKLRKEKYVQQSDINGSTDEEPGA